MWSSIAWRNDLYLSLDFALDSQSSKRKTREPKEENVTLGPAVREGEHVFGVAHIFASFNDTFIVSDMLFFVLSFYGAIVCRFLFNNWLVVVGVIAAYHRFIREGNSCPDHWYVFALELASLVALFYAVNEGQCCSLFLRNRTAWVGFLRLYCPGTEVAGSTA